MVKLKLLENYKRSDPTDTIYIRMLKQGHNVILVSTDESGNRIWYLIGVSSRGLGLYTGIGSRFAVKLDRRGKLALI